MDPIIGGSLIGGGLGLLGGSISNNYNADQARRAQYENLQAQREFAQHGISWKVQDAKSAGINPLVALGAQTFSYAPQSVGATDSIGPALQNMGSDVTRAVHATASQDERDTTLKNLAITNASLQNDLLQTQVTASKMQLLKSTGPALPSAIGSHSIPGSGATTQITPAKIIASQRGQPAAEAGAVSDFGYVRTPRGGLAIVPSSDAKEKIEDQMIPEAMWGFRNTLVQNFDPSNHKPNPRELPPPKGYDDYEWDSLSQSYVPVRRVKNTRSKWIRKSARFLGYPSYDQDYYNERR